MIDYDPHDWHGHFFDVKGSMVREIFGRILAVVAWSVLVVGLLTGQLVYTLIIGVPTGVLVAMVILGRRAERAAYTQIEEWLAGRIVE